AGIALAILTMALCEILRISISASRALGMDDGLNRIPRPSLGFGLFEVSLNSASAYYWFLCISCGLCALLMWWLMLGRFGRVLRCIRQDPERAEFLGVRIGKYRVIAFSLSGGVATLAGALLAPWTQIVTPDAASALRSLQPMLSTLLGGAEFFWGPAVGAVLFAAISYGTRTLTGVSEVVSGLLLLIIVLAAPTGVLGILARLKARRAGTDQQAPSLKVQEVGKAGA
ncbi:MAG: branched-chain amino acid ABC transporter permease, partial [Burkholderiaceae bacterium]|nr:branched-chain amino acid ABC transporter permease [Burkholderiaceae bacterium]